MKRILFESDVDNNVDSAICRFENQTYKNDGLAMGLPLAPLVAQVFMSELENDVFNNSACMFDISCIGVFVDV